MTNFQLFQNVSNDINKLVTQKYSSSFSRSIIFLEPEIRKNIYNIYGFVRIADEIVDTFHQYNKKQLLDQFIVDYKNCLKSGISLNPILHGFCNTQKKYNISQNLIDSFLESMYMDLGDMSSLNQQEYEKYIYGSAEVVGLMCLSVFLNGDIQQFNALKPAAKSLGAALQKVNFLRDIQADFNHLNRTYFPNVDFGNFNASDKQKIEADIENDFNNALIGIKKLPLTSRFAVYLAYRYYKRLFNKIRSTDSSVIMKKRIRVNDMEKAVLFSKIMVYKTFNLASYIH